MSQPETWRAIPGHERYEVSDRGRVRNAETGHVLRAQRCGNGYAKVHLGRGVQRMVHRLVCLTFHGPPPTPNDHADHLDFDKLNNDASNLRWLSATLNTGRQVRWGPRGWETVADEEQPEDFTPLDDDERARIDQRLAADGW